MNKLLGGGLVQLAALLMISGANAATVETAACAFRAATCATGISGLIVDDSLYDVDFQWGSFIGLNVGGNFPFIGNESNAQAAVDAMALALNGSPATFFAYGDQDVTFSLVPFDDELRLTRIVNHDSSSWFTANGLFNRTTPTGYAVFTFVAPVPVPAAVWLFASGLGLLGWMRRRQT